MDDSGTADDEDLIASLRVALGSSTIADDSGDTDASDTDAEEIHYHHNRSSLASAPSSTALEIADRILAAGSSSLT